MTNIKIIENSIKYDFVNKALLEDAITHTSFVNNKKDYTKHTLTRKHKRKVNALKLKPPSITPLQMKNKEKKEMEQQEIKEK